MSHQNTSRRRLAVPTLYNHRPDTATVVRVSNDGRRTREEIVSLEHPSQAVPGYWREDLDTNAALDAEDFDYAMGDTSLAPEDQAPESDGISVRVKSKRYENSDLPFRTWALGHRDEYLDKVLRGEGRGDAAIYSFCGGCGERDPEYCCENQACYGTQMFCRSCIVARHQVLPTHWIQEWNGSFFEHVSLNSLGLVVQLRHTPGATCTTMQPGKFKFTLIDSGSATATHELPIDSNSSVFVGGQQQCGIHPPARPSP
ncbi:hypothetical protein B0H14DRAFT_2637195 [Mycena olivaceomarginata]|nr:hypothetical protein B0H14DRAFT_2637195 [Mycena olivaceomarginata]